MKLNKENIYYKYDLLKSKSERKTRCGQNRETILLTINYFRKFCMKARTKESEKIYDFLINN